MQSAGDPELLPEGAVSRAMNMVRRGGIYQCRPGYRERMVLPTGKLQGFTWFRPTGGAAQLVFVVGGNVYVSEYPFETYHQLTALTFSAEAEQAYFARCVQSVVRNEDNSLTVINPISVLIIQDGKSPPAGWNGSTATHIFGNESTPLGTAMAWSGDRLWVANKNRLLAGDIYNPFSFREGQYIGETNIGAFILPGEITALAEAPSTDTPFLLAFTQENTTAFQSNVRNRAIWSTITPNFQKVVFPETGCTSQRSVVSQHGYLWWYSQEGLTNMDLASQTNVSSQRKVADTAMAYSKRRLNDDLSGVASARFGGYLLVSVPCSDVYNRHTWCADLEGQDTNLSEEPPTWDSYWVGTRPVEWTTTELYGRERIFHISKDRDGQNRLWEAFMPEKADNHSPITWALETRGYLFGTKQPKRWKYAKLAMSEFWGETHLKITWAGTMRGRYKQSGSKIIRAQRGVVRAADTFSYDTKFFALKKQSRTVTTEDVRQVQTDKLDSCPTESDKIDQVDYGFQMCILGMGPGGLRSIRCFAHPENPEASGACEKHETQDFRLTRFDGGASFDDSFSEAVQTLLSNPPSFYESCGSASINYGGYNAVGAACESSVISQEAAAYRAQQVATARAAEDLRRNGQSFFGGFASGECFATTEPFL
jgi:hypothetical protein